MEPAMDMREFERKAVNIRIAIRLPKAKSFYEQQRVDSKRQVCREHLSYEEQVWPKPI